MKKVKLHEEDKNVIINFIDYVRLSKYSKVLSRKGAFVPKENVNLEIAARYVAEFLGISPDQSNARLANKFASLLESGKVA